MYELNNIDISTPDYFSGSKHPVIAVELFKTITFNDIKQSLLSFDKLSYNVGYIENLDETAYIEAVEALFYNVDLTSQPKCVSYIEDEDLDDLDEDLDDLDEDLDDIESVYMYFDLRTIEED